MVTTKKNLLLLFLFILLITGCQVGIGSELITPPTIGLFPTTTVSATPTELEVNPSQTLVPTPKSPLLDDNSNLPTQTDAPTSTISPTPTATEVVFNIGKELTIAYLRDLEISGSEITFEETLPDRSSYHQHLVSYLSEGNRIYGLLTIPFEEPPPAGYKAVVFNHGYIPPATYQTIERYTAYVDYLARNGFVVFKIDLRGHGNSEGEPTGSYFSPAYTIDAIAALKSLQKLDIIDPQGIGMWGHSMAGNLVLRAMLVEPDIKAGVIWAGAVYSYDDFAQYGITDNTYRPPATPETQETPDPRRSSREIFDTYGRPDTQIEYWQAVSLTENIEYLVNPLQLHHAQDDSVVNIGYSFDLAAVLQENGKQYEFFSYEGGGHNLNSPYFNQAMQRTVEFFRDNL